MIKRSMMLGLILNSILYGEVIKDETNSTNREKSEQNINVLKELVLEENKINIYERNCIPCHRYLPLSLEHMYMRYLKTFSGEKTFKASLKVFLKHPMEQTSVMSDLFIDRFSVKDKSLLNDKQLDEAIDIYWNLYNVRNKLK